MRIKSGLAAILTLFLFACIAEKQDFQVGSPQWELVNPHWVGITARGDENVKNHQVLVGVVDSGIDYNHPKLQRSIHPFSDPQQKSGRAYYLGYDFLGSDLFPFYRVIKRETSEDLGDDLYGAELSHGTQVAFFASLNMPTIGIVPMRVLPVADIEKQSMKALYPELDEASRDDAYLFELFKQTIDSIYGSFEFASRHEVSILNLSLGIDLNEVPARFREPALEYMKSHLVQPLLRHIFNPALYVVAAGNEKANMTAAYFNMPATWPVDEVLTVGALDKKRLAATFTNYGKYVDIFVRGEDVRGIYPALYPGHGPISGTSFSAPLIANLAAQLKMIAPKITPLQLKALILNSADLIETAMPTQELGLTGQPQRVRAANFKRAKKMLRDFVAAPSDQAAALIFKLEPRCL